MKEIFTNVDRFLAVAGFAAALFSIWLAYYFYKKTVRSKILAFAFTKPVPLLLPVPNVTVLYGGNPQTAICRVFLLLWNRGTEPIEQAHFIAPIKIGDNNSLLALVLRDKDAAASVSINHNSNEITVELLRPREAVLLRIDVAEENYKPALSIQMKSANMSEFIPMERGMLPSVFGWITGLGFFFYTLIAEPFGTPKPKMDGSIIDFLIVGAPMLLALVCGASAGWITLFTSRKFLLGRISPVAAKFFELQLAAMSISLSWTSFKKQLNEVLSQN